MSKDQTTPLCPIHQEPMLMMYGAGWDYDRWMCGVRGCYEEIELETSTLLGEEIKKMSKIDLKVKIDKESFELIQEALLENGVYWDSSGNIKKEYSESFFCLYYRAKTNALQYGMYKHNFESDAAKEVDVDTFLKRIV